MQAVILAAGRGERMRALTQTKPLLSLLGISLLERSIRTVQSCGVTEVIVVTGHGEEAIKTWLHQYRAHPGAVSVRLVHNEEWADTENGTSLLAAAPYITDSFLLLMADHVYTPELIKALCAATVPEAGSVLATDGNVNRTDIDPDDVTHVQREGDYIKRIDKGLHPHDGFDTGAFLCSPEIIKLMQAEHDAGRTRISDVMQVLADTNRLLALPVDGMYWQDVDTPTMHDRAEEGLLKWAAGKPADGIIARRANRPLSKRLTRLLTRTRITPNQVSFVAFAIGLLAAFFLARGHYWSLLLGGLLVQLASIVDGCDGELARLRLAPSNYGGWLDALLDRYADAAILAGLTWHIIVTTHSPSWMWLGVLAISGSFISSYTAHKADTLLPHSRWRIGRDTRSFVIMVGAILAFPVATLWLIAISMNAVVVHRVVTMRRMVMRQPGVASQL